MNKKEFQELKTKNRAELSEKLVVLRKQLDEALLARALGEAKDLKLGMKIRHDIARISGIMPKQDTEVVSTKKATK
ncbi:50S ribosomal protein L29 [Candidatus Woesebacteria bacterium]|jgi:ribosomal protein L29|nr:50S ribosomal protein L29 [Candidatus Woesebacteria bacterium]MBP9687070.1 50S ribosomal protein L29 [Candidatus Woesebacteria bacterium]